jgi:membrane-associated protease RseP (regulator of RpoE activity)
MPDDSPPLEYQIFDPERQEIRVVTIPPLKRRTWLHVLLFLATLFSTLCIGAHLQNDFNRGVWPFSDDNNALPWTWALGHWRQLYLGIPFSLCLLGILTAHELGHYVLCRRRGVQATLPFFIPFPSLFGTLGAVIRIRSPIHSRKDLFDIGIAGPIAGFVVAVPVLFVGLLASTPLYTPVGEGWPVLGVPLIFEMMRWLLHATGIHVAAAYLGASELYLSPIAIAAWVGMLATALNLLPGGQLDGGHIIFALNPRAHRTVSNLTILALLVLSWYFWVGWLVWAILLRVTGSRHPMVPLQPGLNRKSRMLSLLGAVMLLLTWMPAPVASFSLPEVTKGLRDEVRQMIQEWIHRR